MKKAETIFKANNNPTYEYIHINNEKVIIKFERTNISFIEISFQFEGKKYFCKKSFDQNSIFIGNDIYFGNNLINEIDLERLSDRLNEMIDAIFN